MTNNDDPLIAEIEKMIIDIEEYEEYIGMEVKKKLRKVSMMILARQQVEKEKMIAKLEAYKPTREQQLDNPLLSLGMTSGMIYAIEVIQGKEQKEERVSE